VGARHAGGSEKINDRKPPSQTPEPHPLPRSQAEEALFVRCKKEITLVKNYDVEAVFVFSAARVLPYFY
jgi:hypothetical protein